jgi:Na+-transporting methylmalonyl-CoA/oxaloacetate decarboxylase gamma subunit
MEFNVLGFVVMFLLVIVLVMQIQMSNLSRKIDEKEEILSQKMDELLKEKKEPKITQHSSLDSSHP